MLLDDYPSLAETVLIETLQVFPPDVAVRSIMVASSSVVALSDNEVVSVPVQRCAEALTCGSCLALRDPYCAWDAAAAECVAHADVPEERRDALLQELDRKITGLECPVEIATPLQGELYIR